MIQSQYALITFLFTFYFIFLTHSYAITGTKNVTEKYLQQKRYKIPEFEETENIIIAKEGSTAILPCKVKNLMDNVVSWIRVKDLTILTSGILTFTADYRFQIDNSDEISGFWKLRIARVSLKDSGIYECQVNTEPKMKKAISLRVLSEDIDEEYDNKMEDSILESVATIIGPTDQYVKIGDTVTFTCQVTQNVTYNMKDAMKLDDFLKFKRIVNWFHISRILTPKLRRGGISIDTEKSSDVTLSRLTIFSVIQNDTGEYSCKPTRGKMAIVNLHVVQDGGEMIQAMLPENYTKSSSSRYPSIILNYIHMCAIFTLFLVVR